MSTYQKPRGTIDYYGKKLQQLVYIENTILKNAKNFGFSEIRTPIFEHTEVFVRSVGESSDIVNKEIYNFDDKGGRNIALRPEGTAGVIRAINENKILQNTNYPVRLFYYGPIFRYERPQSGRSRQFNQFGFEILNTNNYLDDVDCLMLAVKCLNDLNITKYKIYINNIGSIASRTKWIEALKVYFEPYKNQLSQDSINRLNINPLRILDDKEDGKKNFVKNAPKMEQFLTSDEKQEFCNITTLLNKFNIKYEIDSSLVRGLDYYSNLVFEFVSELDELKGQSTICGGGRYNNLIHELGGIEAQAVGFAFGLERLLIQYETENKENNIINNKQFDVAFINLSDDLVKAYEIVNELRQNNISVCFEPDIKKVKTGFKFSENMQTKYVVLLGNNELSEQCVMIKDQNTMQEQKVTWKELVNFFK